LRAGTQFTFSTGKAASTYVANLVFGFATGDVDVRLFDPSCWQSSSTRSLRRVTSPSSARTWTAPTSMAPRRRAHRAHRVAISLSKGRRRAEGCSGAEDDEDGSGTVNLIEIFCVLMANGFAQSTPVEFHWYSGEEAGLLGEQDISIETTSTRARHVARGARPAAKLLVTMNPAHISKLFPFALPISVQKCRDTIGRMQQHLMAISWLPY